MLALREGIINAIVHRDYSNQVRDIKIGIYDDIVEIVSPGGLPSTLTIEQIYSGRSEIRNRVLARVFKELDYIEKWGSGINRMINLCRDVKLKVPEIRETGDSISLVFYRKDYDLQNDTGLVPDNTGLDKLSETEREVLELVQGKTRRKDIELKLSLILLFISILLSISDKIFAIFFCILISGITINIFEKSFLFNIGIVVPPAIILKYFFINNNL